MNYNTKIALGAIGIIAIVLLILWYTGFFKKEKATVNPAVTAAFRAGVSSVGGTTTGFSDAARHYDDFIKVTDAQPVTGCTLLSDDGNRASDALAANPPRNPCVDPAINTNNSNYKTLLKGSYKVDITASFVAQGGQTSLIEESGIYCCQDATAAALQDNALIENFKMRKEHALRMKEAATTGASSLAAASTRAANSVRQYNTQASGAL